MCVNNILNKIFFLIVTYLQINLISINVFAAPVFYEIREKQLVNKYGSEYTLIKNEKELIQYIKNNDNSIEEKKDYKKLKDKIKLRQIYSKYNIRELCRDLKKQDFRLKREERTNWIIIENVIIDCTNPTFQVGDDTKIINNISIENTKIKGSNTNFGIDIK